MTTFGITMVKDEADVIEATVRHAAHHVDALIVLDNASTDGTRELLAGLAALLPLQVVDDPEPGYWQSRKMTRLAERAAAAGATWIVPFDADELWSHPAGRLAEVLADQPLDVDVVPARMFDHRCTALDDLAEPNPFLRMAWREPVPAPMGKVAIRWQPGAAIHQGNHGVELRRGGRWSAVTLLEIRHFQWRSPEHMVRKARNGAAAYRATTLPAWEGAHWRNLGDLLDRHGEAAVIAQFHRQYHHDDPAAAGLVHDPAPYAAR